MCVACVRAKRGPHEERTLLVPPVVGSWTTTGRGWQGFLYRGDYDNAGLPRLIIRVYPQRLRRRSAVRSGAERNGADVGARRAAQDDIGSEERMAGRLRATARMLAVCLVYLWTLLGELLGGPYARLSPSAFPFRAPTLSVRATPLAPCSSWWLLVPRSPQSHSLKNAPYEPAGTWPTIDIPHCCFGKF